MNEPFEPRPEGKGALAPPSRRPPTAVGVSTPPPPPPHRRHKQRGVRGVFQPLYIFTATCIGGGTALLLLAPWLLLRLAGATAAVVGLIFCSMILWVRSGAAASWSLRREYRSIRKRQSELTQSARTSA